MADVALPAPPARRTRLLWATLTAAAVALFVAGLAARPALQGDPATAAALDQVLLWQSRLPRAAVALLAGAALGLAGALLQRALRNPIADASTLGIASGAQLALTLATLHAPALAALSRSGVAFAGGVAAVAIVLAVAWKRGLEPVTVALAGMVLSLVAAALGAAMVLADGEYVLSLFIWGAGSLNQQGWDVAVSLAVRLGLGAAAAALLIRPLAVLGLDDASARSLGLGLAAARTATIAVAVWLAAGVTAEVGIIGFVGLAAPALARLGGARSPTSTLLAAPFVGALVLWLADGLVQVVPLLQVVPLVDVVAFGGADAMPTGAAAGLLGGPLLLWLLPKLSMAERPVPAAPPPRRARRPRRAIAVLAAAIVLAAVLGLVVGRDFDGWSLATGALFADLLPFRLPRLVVAASAGALLAAAGTLLQRLTGNPLAGPEVLGAGAGAGVGLAAVLLLAAAPGTAAMMAGSSVGALAILAAVLAFAARAGFGPERLVLAGIALGALCLAVVTAVLAAGGPGAFQLLVWLSGSTDKAGPAEAGLAAAAALALIAPLPLLGRWLDVLPLGEAVGRSLGLAVTASRAVLALLAALMVAAAALVLGPLSLVGLIGPHAARLLGFVRGTEQLVAASLLGAGLMIAVDWLGRVVAFPYQIPAGLLAALVGGPYLVWLLRRGPSRQA